MVLFSKVFHSLSQVTLLFPLFHEHSGPQRVQDGEAEPLLILRDINDYNRRFSGQPRSVGTIQLHIFRGPRGTDYLNTIQYLYITLWFQSNYL